MPSLAANGVVSVICRPITMSDCVASLTFHLAEKKALFVPSIKKDSPFKLKKSASLSPAALVIKNWPPAPEVIASVADPVPS